MQLRDYKKEYKRIALRRKLSGQDALSAVSNDGMLLRYVKNQTKEICLKAVKQDGIALQYVKNQTEAICIEAIKQHRDALKYVNESFFD